MVLSCSFQKPTCRNNNFKWLNAGDEFSVAIDPFWIWSWTDINDCLPTVKIGDLKGLCPKYSGPEVGYKDNRGTLSLMIWGPSRDPKPVKWTKMNSLLQRSGHRLVSACIMLLNRGLGPYEDQDGPNCWNGPYLVLIVCKKPHFPHFPNIWYVSELETVFLCHY